jgi:phosphoribosyl-dephospho-CoA transferase
MADDDRAVVVNIDLPYRTHDLVCFRVRGYEDHLPDWVDRVRGHSWAVVRRQEPTARGMIAAGVRGRERSERQAVELRVDDIVRRLSPEDLVVPSAGLATSTDLPSPGIRASLELITANSSSWFGSRAWGPTGSVGFQLATRVPVVRETSDLDLIVRAREYLSPADARSVLDRLAGLPCRVDCLLETTAGAVALVEWARSSNGDVLLRSARGPRLTKNPWSTEASERVPA